MSVHSQHCCKACGCKYGDENCPVVLGTEKADYACLECAERISYIAERLNSLEDSQRLFLLKGYCLKCGARKPTCKHTKIGNTP